MAKGATCNGNKPVGRCMVTLSLNRIPAARRVPGTRPKERLKDSDRGPGRPQPQ